MWVRAGMAEQLTPTQTGWFADRDIFEMDHTDYSPAPNARRFQSGTPPIPAIYGGIAGMELMQEIGIADIRAHVLALTDSVIDGVDALGGIVVTPRAHDHRGALVCIATDAGAPSTPSRPTHRDLLARR
jgi:kynureninase